MARCSYCKTETRLYNDGTPVCLDCAGRRRAKQEPPAGPDVLALLQRELQQATERAHQATDAFNAIMGDIPSSLPHPDGTQRINNVYRELSFARTEMMRAHSRLGDYLDRGIVPEDFDHGDGS